MIPYVKHPPVTEADLRAVEQALTSDHLTKGPLLEAYEEAVAEFLGVKYVVAVSSGTMALFMAFSCFDHGTWFIPAVTFRATRFAAEDRHDVEVIDVDTLDGMVLDSEAGHARTVPVSIGGTVPPVGTNLVADMCHAFGSAGACGATLTCFSTHACKSLSTGEGGLIATNYLDLAAGLKDMRDVHPFNCRLTEAQAALGLSRLDRVREQQEEKLGLLTGYYARLSHYMAPVDESVNYHLAQLYVREGRDKVVSHLRANGIDARGPLYPPREPLPGAETFSARQVVLPLWVGMGEDVVSKVCDLVEEAME